MTDLLRTPLYPLHVARGGRMVPFGGWEMPIQYTSILEEHRAVRERAGVFDVSHMGEFEITGKDAAAFLDRLVTNWPSTLGDGEVLYTPMTLPSGGCVDDLLVYRFGREIFWLVVNAATAPKDLAWVDRQAKAFGGDVKIVDLSSGVGEIAFQGPLAQEVLGRLTTFDLASIGHFEVARGVDVDGCTVTISRTGYTGEDGFEIYARPEDASSLFEAILKAGRGDGVLPCGLGARDSLRFEACLPLYGQEISEDITPLEAGLGIFVKWDKGAFIGKEALLSQKEKGPSRRLAGLELDERAVPRPHYPVLHEGQAVGSVTSGMISPTLGRPLALALVRADLTSPGTPMAVRVREKEIPAHVVKRPFYRRENRK